MSKFIAFVAALLISTLSFAQQFITFTKEKVEPREGLAISVPDTTALYFDVNDTAWRRVSEVPDLVAVIDLKMTIEEVLNQGYILKVTENNENIRQNQDSKLSVSEILLCEDVFEDQISLGVIEYRNKQDNEYLCSLEENFFYVNGLRNKHRAAVSNIIKI